MTDEIQSKVADTILQRDRTITVGGRDYTVAPPSVATLIEASELISQIPEFNVQQDSDILSETLRTAKHCHIIGDLVALLMIGTRPKKPGLFQPSLKTQRKRIAAECMQLPPSEIRELTTEILKGMEIADFFGFTVFLQEINITKPTRETVETTMIASGL